MRKTTSWGRQKPCITFVITFVLPVFIAIFRFGTILGAVETDSFCRRYSFMRGNRFLTETFHFLLALRLPLLLLCARVSSVGFSLLGLLVAPDQAVELGAVRLAAVHGAVVVRQAFAAVGAEDVLQLPTQLVHYFRPTLCSPSN